MIVYNIEPKNFSNDAKAAILNIFDYQEGSKENLEKHSEKTNILAIIVRLKYRIDAEFLSQFPNLAYILSATTGHDHLDSDYFKKNKIELISLRGENKFLENITSTPELAWGLLLNLWRNIPIASSDVMSGNWNRDAFFGRQLKHKTLGIVGLGRTGKMMATFAKAFQMQVCYYDPFVEISDNELIKESKLIDVIHKSDIISLHIHASPENNQVINKSVLKEANKNLMIVNTSRGSVVNENDLVDWMSLNPKAKYATDVLDGELLGITSSPIWKHSLRHPNQVLITPHIGGATDDAIRECENFITNKFLLQVNIKDS